MNAISKRLLSMLVVVAMVLSMVPFGGLSIFAVETKATETASTESTVTPGQANLPEGVQEIIDAAKTNVVNTDAAINAHIAAGTCPMCGSTEADWTSRTGASSIYALSEQSKHFYYALPEDNTTGTHEYTISNNAIAITPKPDDTSTTDVDESVPANNNTMCVAILSGVTVTSTRYRAIMLGGNGNTINIMGSGTLNSDQGSADQVDYGLMQLGGGTSSNRNEVSLYGGNYQHVTVQDSTNDYEGILRIQSSYVTVNMFDGVVIGPENANTAQWSHNVRINGGILNMYGGTIRNGVAKKNNISGNVTIANNGTMNMYGGTISGGCAQVVDGTAVATTGGNVLVGGLQEAKTSNSKGTFNMYGGTITGGSAAIGGGNIGIKTSGSSCLIAGGKVESGDNDGITTGALGGGNVYAANSTTFKMTGGWLNEGSTTDHDYTNSSGKAASAGGYGGNIHSTGTVEIEGGTISDGTADVHGGNVSVSTGANLKIIGGEIYGGVANAQAGNVRSWQAPVEIGGTVYIHDGQASGDNVNHNVWVQGGSATYAQSLTISGGTIDGDVRVGAYTPLTLTGAPVINMGTDIGLTNAGYTADVSGLTKGASIVLSGVSLDDVVSTACTNAEDAARIAGYFTCDVTSLKVAAASDNTLVIAENVPQVGVFDPEAFDGMAYCDACLAQGVAEDKALVKWTAYNGENYSDASGVVLTGAAGAHFHLYLDGDKTYESGKCFLVSYRNVCFNLNGHDITADAGAKHTFGVTQVLNIFDSEGGAVVTGNNTSATSGSALHLNGGSASGTYNIYGGTFTKLADSAGPVFMIGSNGGRANMYGGTIDATGKSSTNGAAVYIQGNVDTDLTDTKNRNASFTMYGGEIKGGTATNGGAVCVGGTGTNYVGCATFTLEDGTISGGTATGNGGNIYINKGNTLNIKGGTIDGGTATNGGNIYVSSGIFNLQDGTVQDGHATNAGGNIHYGSGTMTATGGAVKNGTCDDSATGGGNIYITGGNDLEITSGTWEGGSARNGGNIYVYNGSLVVKGDAVIDGGTAVPSSTGTGGMGGAIYKYGTADNHNLPSWDSTQSFVKIQGNAVVKNGNAKTGGNLYVSGYLTVADNAKIYDGKATGNAGNIYMSNPTVFVHYYTKGGDKTVQAITTDEWSALSTEERKSYSTYTVATDASFEMTGGSVYGGTAGSATNSNIVIANTNMYLTGGEITGTTGVGGAGSCLRIGSGSVLYLGGDATVVHSDGIETQGLQLQGDQGTIRIAKDWTGKATVGFNSTFGPGDTVKTTIESTDHYNGLVGDITKTVAQNGTVSYNFVEDTTEAGTYAGTLIQERGPMYYGILGVKGKLVIASAGVAAADETVTWYGDNAAALKAYNYGTDAYVILSGTAEISGDVVVEMNGSALELTGTGTVYGMDNSNDDYSGYKKLTVADTVTVADEVTNPVNGNRYIALKESDGTWGFHRVEMILTHVTLRTTEAGLYYKAKYLCDDTLAGRVLGYGVVLSTANMPGADFMTETGDINDYTMIDGPLAPDAETHTATTTSGGLFGILKDPSVAANDRTADANVTAAQTNVYANLYLAVDKDGEGNFNTAKFFMGDTENEGSTTAGTFWNLLGVMEAINDGWASYNETQQILIKTTVEKWAGWITEAAQTEWAGKFSNILA